jgi:ectoine hydroxylase-related dioxygenase (phytanoyl-CoA dioxygenase family)
MTTIELSAAQLTQFREEGYTVVPRFFDSAELAALVAELERFKHEGLGRNVATDGDGKTHSTTKINYQIIPLNNKSNLLRALPFHPRVLSVVGQLIGNPFARQLDQIFLKPAHTGAGTNWHTDNAYFKISDPTKGTAMWIALHDATLANGTLHVIPGSYRESFAHERDLGSDHHIHMQVDEARAVAIELPAGGAIFFNYGTAHATKANTTAKERAGLAFHFVRSDYIPENYPWQQSLVQLTGPQATGGLQEYGVAVADSWENEVRQVLEGR